jgi:hypothetical protein
MPKKAEKQPETKREARDREWMESNEQKYLEYWLTLNEHDQKLVPKPQRKR